MRPFILFLFVALISACSQENKQGEEQAGTATTSVSGEVISGNMGYIVENARFTGTDEQETFSIKGALELSPGDSQVLIIRTESAEGGFTELLALQFPSFAAGSRIEYTPGDDRSHFWVFGVDGDEDVMRRTGTIEGTVRFVKKEEADNSLGLSRKVINGVGEIEIVVTGIDNSGITVQAEKKYAARFRLPMITLDELSRINQPI